MSSGQHHTVTVAKCFRLISRLSKHPVTTVRGEGGIGARECQGAWVVIRKGWFLDFNIPQTAQGQVKDKSYILESFTPVQNTNSPVESWITVLTQQMQSTVKS